MLLRGLKNIGIAFLMATMILAGIGCSGENTVETKEQMGTTEAVQEETQSHHLQYMPVRNSVEWEGDLYIADVILQDDVMQLIALETTISGDVKLESKYYMREFTLDGTMGAVVPLEGFPTGQTLRNVVGGASGFYFLFSDFEKSITIIKTDAEGKILFQRDQDYMEIVGSHYVSDLILDKDENLYFQDVDTRDIHILDKEGEKKHIINGQEKLIANLVKNKNGDIFACAGNESQIGYYPISPETGELGEVHTMERAGVKDVVPGGIHDFMLLTGDRLEYYDMSEEESQTIGLLATWGIDSELIRDYAVLRNGNIVFLLGEVFTNTYQILVLEKTAGEEDLDHVMITIASLMPDENLQSLVSEYNRGGHDYILVINSYYDDLNGEGSMADALTRLNADLANGTAGDLLDIVSLEQVATRQSYVKQGLLENLYPYIEGHLNKEDYLENMFTSYEIDGGLYNIAPFYNISAGFIRQSILKQVDEWTLEGLLQAKEKLDKPYFWESNLREDFVQDFCVYQLPQWFGSEERSEEVLKQFLSLGELMDISGQAQESDAKKETDYQCAYEDKTMLYGDFLYGRYMGYVEAKSLFQEDTVMVGFPSGNQSDIGIDSKVSLGICIASEKKEAAWGVLSWTLSKEIQELVLSANSVLTQFLPMHKAVLEETYDNLDEYYRYQSIGYQTGDGDVQVQLESPTKREFDALILQISNATHIDEIDPYIVNIVQEEADKYYSGESTLDEAVARMKQRLVLYYNEQQ